MKPIHTRQCGVTLVELMIALVLGLLLMAGVINVFLGSKQTYRTSEALSRVQESGRFALEFITYDVRMAGLTGCASTNRIANTLNNPSAWWADFGNGGIIGYDGATSFADAYDFGNAQGNRVAGTHAFVIRGGSGNKKYTIVEHQETSAQFKLSTLHDLTNGSIVMVCDNRQASIMQLTNVNSNNVTIVHNTGTGSPGNCTKGLGYPVVCTTNGTPYQYGPDAEMVEFSAFAYYIGNGSSPGSRSLYRVRLSVAGGNAGPLAEELVENVYDMRVLYGEDTNGNGDVNAYSAASAVTDWNNVIAARVCVLPYSGETNVATAAMTLNCHGTNIAIPENRLAQAFDTTIGLRNRLP